MSLTLFEANGIHHDIFPFICHLVSIPVICGEGEQESFQRSFLPKELLLMESWIELVKQNRNVRAKTNRQLGYHTHKHTHRQIHTYTIKCFLGNYVDIL